MIKKILQIVALLLTFVVPILHLLFKLGFSTETITITTQTVTSTKHSYNLFILFVIMVLVFVILIWLIIGTLIKWWSNIKDNPFGVFSVLVFGVIIFIILGSFLWGFNMVRFIITNNSQSLVDGLTTYIKEFKQVLTYVVLGVLMNIGLLVWDKFK